MFNERDDCSGVREKTREKICEESAGRIGSMWGLMDFLLSSLVLGAVHFFVHKAQEVECLLVVARYAYKGHISVSHCYLYVIKYMVFHNDSGHGGEENYCYNSIWR